MRFTRTIVAVGAAGLTALALVSCGSDTSSRPATDSGDAGKVIQLYAAQAALTSAAAAVPDGQPFDLEIQVNRGQQQFTAKVASHGEQFNLIIDPTGTDVVRQIQTNDAGDDVAKLDGIGVTAEQALQTAADAEDGARFRELEIDTDSAGAVVWQLTLVRTDGSQAQYTVDAHSGEVISAR